MNWRLIRWVVAGIAVSTEIAAFVVWRRSQRFVAHSHAAPQSISRFGRCPPAVVKGVRAFRARG